VESPFSALAQSKPGTPVPQVEQIEDEIPKDFKSSNTLREIWSLFFSQTPGHTGAEEFLRVALNYSTEIKSGQNVITLANKDQIFLDRPYVIFGAKMTLREIMNAGDRLRLSVFSDSWWKELFPNEPLYQLDLDHGQRIIRDFKQYVLAVETRRKKGSRKYTDREAEVLARSVLNLHEAESRLSLDEKKILNRQKNRYLEETVHSPSSAITQEDLKLFFNSEAEKIHNEFQAIEETVVSWIFRNLPDYPVYGSEVSYHPRRATSIESFKEQKQLNSDVLRNGKIEVRYFNEKGDRIKDPVRRREEVSVKLLILTGDTHSDFALSPDIITADRLRTLAQAFNALRFVLNFYVPNIAYVQSPEGGASREVSAERLMVHTANRHSSGFLAKLYYEEYFLNFEKYSVVFSGGRTLQDGVLNYFQRQFPRNKFGSLDLYKKILDVHWLNRVEWGFYALGFIRPDYYFERDRLTQRAGLGPSRLIDLLFFDERRDMDCFLGRMKGLPGSIAADCKTISPISPISTVDLEKYQPTNSPDSEEAKKPLFRYKVNQPEKSIFFHLDGPGAQSSSVQMSISDRNLDVSASFLELVTEQPIFANGMNWVIPSPENREISKIHVVLKDGVRTQNLREGVDYLVYRSRPDRFSYFLALQKEELRNAALEVRATFLPSIPVVAQDFRLRDLRTLELLGSELQNDGFIQLGGGIRDFLKDHQTANGVRAKDLEMVFRKNAFYTYQSEKVPTAVRPPPLPSENLGILGQMSGWVSSVIPVRQSQLKRINPLFAPFKVFLREDGALFYQCDGGNLLLKTFFEDYLERAKTADFSSVGVEGGMVGKEGVLSNSGRHLRTRMKGMERQLVLDGTPGEMDPDQPEKMPSHLFDRDQKTQEHRPNAPHRNAAETLKIVKEKKTLLFQALEKHPDDFKYKMEAVMKSYRITAPPVVAFRMLDRIEKWLKGSLSPFELDFEMLRLLGVPFSNYATVNLETELTAWLKSAEENLKQYQREKVENPRNISHAWALDPFLTEKTLSALAVLREISPELPKMGRTERCQTLWIAPSENQ
jgi:hypothetical protein